MKTLAIATIFFLLAAHTLFAVKLTDGNILISDGAGIYEYTHQGALVQKVATLSDVRDIAVDRQGIIYAYHGTFTPVLRIIDPATGTIDSLTCPEWSTVSNASYGGVAVFDSFVFVTDMFTSGNSDAGKGIVRFNVKEHDARRFATNLDPIDLNIGKDNLLYVLSPGGSPEGRAVYRYNPVNCALIDTIDLTSIFGWTGQRSIAAAANGDMFIANFDGNIHHIDHNGTVIKTITLSTRTRYLDDIDIARGGTLIVGNQGASTSNLFIYDTSLVRIDSIDLHCFSAIFVTPVELGATTMVHSQAHNQVAKDPKQVMRYSAGPFRSYSEARFTLTGRLVRPAGGTEKKYPVANNYYLPTNKSKF
jgi:hypothetical protein